MSNLFLMNLLDKLGVFVHSEKLASLYSMLQHMEIGKFNVVYFTISSLNIDRIYK